MQAVNRIIEMRGGLVVVSADEVDDIPLPIAGLMAPLSGHEIAFRTMMLREKVRSIGCTMKAPFITMAFMALPVIPNIKLTDRHLMDTKEMRIIVSRRNQKNQNATRILNTLPGFSLHQRMVSSASSGLTTRVMRSSVGQSWVSK